MSAPKHTAGPWFVSRDHLCETLVRAKDANNGQRIASTFVSHATQANAETRLVRIRENEANARLIAAAPDLLEALTDSRKAIASLDEYALGGCDIIDTGTGEAVGQYPIRDELLSKINAAIAKATGEGAS